MHKSEGGQILRPELSWLSAETLKEYIKRRPVVEAVDPVRAAVTSIGSPTARQPCCAPIPSGSVEAIPAAITESVSTRSPWN